MICFAGGRDAAPTVLVVEDEVLIQMLLVEALEAAGLNVIEADNADAAVKALSDKQTQIRVVVTDLRMPGSIDGLGLACWMRGNAPAVPIIITSGFYNQPEIASFNPAIAFIFPKPYDPGEVVNQVRRLIDGSANR